MIFYGNSKLFYQATQDTHTTSLGVCKQSLKRLLGSPIIYNFTFLWGDSW